jgi:hypothetical protein
MENQIDFALVLANARNEVAESVVRAYGAERAYAVNLNEYFGFNWYDVEATDKTEASAQYTQRRKSYTKYYMVRSTRTRPQYGQEFASMDVKKLKVFPKPVMLMAMVMAMVKVNGIIIVRQ